MNRVSLLMACFVLTFSACSSRPDPKQEGIAIEPTMMKPADPKAGDVVTNSIGMKFAYIPAGEFTMGSPREEQNRGAEEQHQVKISKAFYLGIYELKQREHDKVMGKQSWVFADPDNPANNISWDDAVEFCKRLSEIAEEKQAGRVYRLPTDAEWEYACRAGTTTAYHCGDSLTAKQANFGSKTTVRCGLYPPNAWGLYDMHGNVSEWCLDGPRIFTRNLVEDPRGSEQGFSRILRGGGYNALAHECGSARRPGLGPNSGASYMGFRVLLVW